MSKTVAQMWNDDWPQPGDEVEEIVTGQRGVVTGFSAFLWGCEQVCVGRTDKDEKLDSQWYDLARVKIVKRGALSAVEHKARPIKKATKARGADVLPAAR